MNESCVGSTKVDGSSEQDAMLRGEQKETIYETPTVGETDGVEMLEHVGTRVSNEKVPEVIGDHIAESGAIHDG